MKTILERSGPLFKTTTVIFRTRSRRTEKIFDFLRPLRNGTTLNTIKVDPVDGAVSVVISFKAIDNAGKESANTANAIVPFTASVVTPPPELILLKRITKINSPTTGKKADGTPIDLTLVVAQPDNAATPRDESNDATNPNWVVNYPKGAIDGGVIQSGDLVEYTIYFLSAGGKPVTNANFCDWVPKNTAFVPDTYGLGRGIQLAIAPTPSNSTACPPLEQTVPLWSTSSTTRLPLPKTSSPMPPLPERPVTPTALCDLSVRSNKSLRPVSIGNPSRLTQACLLSCAIMSKDLGNLA